MIRTQATPEQIAAFHEQVVRSGRFGRKPSQAALDALDAGRKKGHETRAARGVPKLYVPSRLVHHSDGCELQLPIYTTHKDGKAQRFKRIGNRNTVAYALLSTGFDRASLGHITFTRIGPQPMDRKDNLRYAFKYVLDPTARWTIEGPAMLDSEGRVRTDGIGTFDKKLEEMGITWDYQQEVCDTDRRRHGIRIRLTPKSSTACST